MSYLSARSYPGGLPPPRCWCAHSFWGRMANAQGNPSICGNLLPVLKDYRYEWLSLACLHRFRRFCDLYAVQNHRLSAPLVSPLMLPAPATTS
jgi:hypothetical protein